MGGALAGAAALAGRGLLRLVQLDVNHCRRRAKEEVTVAEIPCCPSAIPQPQLFAQLEHEGNCLSPFSLLTLPAYTLLAPQTVDPE